VLIYNEQVSWLKFIAALRLPGCPVTLYKAAHYHSGGTASD